MKEDEVDHATLALTRALEHNRIGTEHLPLGLLRVEQGLAARGFGADRGAGRGP